MIKSIALLVIAVIACTGCVTPEKKAVISDAQLGMLEKEADGGSPVAAYRIFLASAAQDARAMKYLRLAASGDRYVPAMSVLGAILLDSQDATDRAEGERYLRGAALSGDPDAQRYLELHGIKW